MRKYQTRMRKWKLPHKPMLCPHKDCVYNEKEKCDDCYTNRGNSDAKCYKYNIKDILGFLKLNNRSI